MSGSVATFCLISVGQSAVVTRYSSVFDEGAFDAISKKIKHSVWRRYADLGAGYKSGTHEFYEASLIYTPYMLTKLPKDGTQMMWFTCHRKYKINQKCCSFIVLPVCKLIT
jgi:hypothetical protein